MDSPIKTQTISTQTEFSKTDKKLLTDYDKLYAESQWLTGC